MSGEINRVPLGLLSLLDMKARGQSPRALAGEVGGSLELLPLYLQQGRRARRQANTVNATGYVALGVFTVPQNQIWIVHHVSMQSAALAAGTTVRLQMAVRRFDDTGTAIPMPIGTPETFGPNEVVGWSLDAPLPYISLPGDEWGIYRVGVTLGVAPSVSCFMDFTPLDI